MEINKMSVGKRIHRIRIFRGLNLREFGELIANTMNLPKKDGPSDSIVSRWEKGVSLPNNERLKAISEIGCISVEELLYGSPKDYLFDLLPDTDPVDTAFKQEFIDFFSSFLGDSVYQRKDTIIDEYFQSYVYHIFESAIIEQNDVYQYFIYRCERSNPNISEQEKEKQIKTFQNEIGQTIAQRIKSNVIMLNANSKNRHINDNFFKKSLVTNLLKRQIDKYFDYRVTYQEYSTELEAKIKSLGSYATTQSVEQLTREYINKDYNQRRAKELAINDFFRSKLCRSLYKLIECTNSEFEAYLNENT